MSVRVSFFSLLPFLLVAGPPPASVAVKVEVPVSMRTDTFAIERTLLVPPGFQISVLARVAGARFLAVAPNGDILVSQPDEGKVVLVRPRTGADPLLFDYAAGLRMPHDIVFHDIGGSTYVFISEAHQINRYRYVMGDVVGRERLVVVSDLAASGTAVMSGHPLKNIALDRNHRLYVSIASSCNACVEDTVGDPLRGAIYQYTADGRGRRLFAQGIRNAEGLAMLPGTEQLWVVINNRDNVAYPYQDASGNYGKVVTDYVDEHPPELFTRVREGGNYGWPFCNSTQDSPSGFDYMQFDRDYQLNRDGVVNCAAMDRITRGFQSHSAPLGLSFLHDTNFDPRYRFGAVAGLHGSWNRSQRTGYKVIYFPWNRASQRPEPEIDLVSGWVDQSSQAVWGRPVDAVPDSGGGLIISDDRSGTLYRLSSAGEPLCVSMPADSRRLAAAAGGSGDIPVQVSGISCNWTVTSSTSWVQLYPPQGSGTGSVGYAVFPNFSTRERTAFLQVGGRSISITQSGAIGTADQRFVQLLYFSSFGRLPAAEELQAQLAALGRGVSRSELVRNFLNSQEFQLGGRFVAGLYIGLLDRDAEYDGWLFQRNAMVTGLVSPGTLVTNFLQSPEYVLRFGTLSNEAFVQLLYQKVLGRGPSPSELAFQSEALRGGRTRTEMASAFLNSAEFRIGKGPRLTAFLLYAATVLRGPSTWERATAVQRVGSGGDLGQIVKELMEAEDFRSALD